jgi:hypothetical protein
VARYHSAAGGSSPVLLRVAPATSLQLQSWHREFPAPCAPWRVTWPADIAIPVAAWMSELHAATADASLTVAVVQRARQREQRERPAGGAELRGAALAWPLHAALRSLMREWLRHATPERRSALLRVRAAAARTGTLVAAHVAAPAARTARLASG